MGEEMNIFIYAKDAFKFAYNVEMKEKGREFFGRLEKVYGLSDVLDAIDIAVEQYDDEITAIHKIEGIIIRRKELKEMFER